MTNIGPSLLVTISGHNIRQILKVSNTVKPNLLKRYGIKMSQRNAPNDQYHGYNQQEYNEIHADPETIFNRIQPGVIRIIGSGLVVSPL